MLKKLLILVFISVVSTFAKAQTATTFIYTNGSQEVERVFNAVDTSTETTCADTLFVTIPAGNYIYSIDVAYNLTSFGQVWTGDLDSYVESVSTNTKEATVANGVGNAPGTEVYSRTNLQIATGVSASGQLKFVLHAFRTFGANSCDTTNARVDDSTFTVTVHHGVAPTCFPPSLPVANWTMSNKAEVSWTTGGATNWQIEYGVTGFALGSGTLINAPSNPFVITGLTANTTYDFYVRDSCGVADVSIWSLAGTFTTLCAPSSSPFTENFDGTGWTPGTGAQNTGDAIAACWVRDPGSAGGDYFWGTHTGTTSSGGTGPTTDNTTGTGNYIYTEASLGAYQSVASITSPLIDLGALTVPEIEFYYHMFGPSCGQLYVEVWSQSTSWQTVFLTSGQQQDSSSQAWIKESVTLNNYANDTILVRFRAIRSFQFDGDIAIDDVKLKEAPTCPKPSNLTVAAFTPTSATLSWTAVGATSWDIEYGLGGFTKGNGTIVNVTTNPGTVTGLTPGANYDFYVREHCSATDTSDWIGPLNLTLPCAPILAPYFQNFDVAPWAGGTGVYNTGDTLAPCWIRAPQAGTNATSDYFWGIRATATSTPTTGPSGDKSGVGNFAYTESSAGSPGQNAALSVPNLDLTPLTNPELRFWYHMFGNGMGTLSIDVISVSTGLNLGVFTLTGQKHANANAAWSEAVVDLSSFTNDTVIIVFRGIRGNNNASDIAIDEVSIDNAPTCPDPSLLMASNILSTSVDLAWTTGGATNWNIASGAPGFTPGATFASATTNPFTLTGLAPGTTYDIYVRDSCAVGDVSNWVGPITIFTLCAPYPAPYAENFDTDFTSGLGNQNAGSTIDSCWTRNPAAGYHWGGRTGATPSGNTGPTSDHTTGTGNYVYVEASAGNNGATADLETPLIDLTSLTVPELTFWYHMYGTGQGDFDVEVNNGGATWTNVFSLSGDQGNAWTKAIVSLSAYAGDTIQIRFIGTRANSFLGDIAVDDLDVHETPLCPDPLNLSASSITSNSVDLAWTTGGATNWNIASGVPGFTPGATFASATTNPFTLTGLTPGTTFDIYVRDSCGTGDVSNWVGPITIFTLCAPTPAPYTENFDGTTWIEGPNFSPGTIDPCWTRTDTTTYWWKPGQATTPSNNTGPSADHTTGFGKYIHAETNGGGTTTSIMLPPIDLSPLTVPELSFYYHMFGALINQLEVEVNNGTGWTVVDTIVGQQQANSTAPWLEEIVDLSAYAGDTVLIRFTGTRNTGFQNQIDIAIDDVDIHEKPNCPKPSALATGATTSTSIEVLWTTGGATNWHIEYGAVGFTPGTGTTVVATTNPFIVTGLTPNTGYDFYVRDCCAVGSVSAWEGPISDTTNCGLFTAPYSENFDGNSWIVGTGGFASGTIDPCWTRSASTQYWWRPGDGPTPTQQTGPSGDHTTGSGKFIYTESQAGSVFTQLTTPEIDLDTLSNPELRFWYHMYGSLISMLHVELYDGNSWNNLDSVVGAQQTSQTDAWQEMVIDISAYAGNTIQIRFNGSKQAGNQNRADISIDDILIDNAPTCLEPTNLASTAITTTTVTLSWTTGGATNWQIEYGPVGFVPGAGTLINAGTNPFIVTGLSPSQTYDFYVRDSCGVGEVSFWEGPITESTACGTVVAPYFENFDADFNEGTNAGNDGSTISPCWSRDVDSAYHWGGGTGGTTTFGTGPNADHTSGFGNYVYTEASFAPNGSEALLETPSIDLSALTSPEMRFWYSMYAQNGTMGTLTWEVFSNNTWTVLDSLVGNQGNTWKEQVVNLSAYANQTIKIRFRGRKANGPTPQQGDIAIDDLSIIDLPSCMEPTAFTATALTLSSVQLAWTTGGSTNWQIEYGLAGFTPGTGTLLNVATNPFTVVGLLPSTTYDFYVRDSCSATDKSLWVGPQSATTFNCVNGCGYTLKLSDTFGDGWVAGGANPNHVVNITIGNITTSYTMLNGFDTIIPINVCDGDTIIVNFVDNGNWDDECGVELLDATNNVVYTGTAPLTPGQLFTGSANCNNPCPTPTATFSNSPNLLSVGFDASGSIGNTLTYSWDFGDGSFGSGVTPSHVYGQDGVYTILLTITDLCGQTDTISQTITICGPLSANFSWAQNGLDLTVDGSLLTNALSWNWTFGDGGTDTGSVVTHPYATSGTYSVMLTVTNLCGVSADTTIIITVCIEPTALWSYKVLSSGSGGMTVQFDGSGSTGANNYFWSFGDGGTNNVSAIPVHTYNVPGLFYVVTLIVTNNCGDDDTLTSSLASIGLEEFTADDIKVYPNPATDRVKINVPPVIALESFSIEIAEMKGATLYKRQYENEQVEINVQGLSAGTYLIKISSTKMQEQKLLIISR